MTKGVQRYEGRGAELLSSPVRRAVVDALAHHQPSLVTVDGAVRAGPRGMTAAQLATQLGLHVTTVRFHIDQLVAGGLVRAEFARGLGVGRPRKVYDVAPGVPGTERDDAGLKALAAPLAEHFDSNLTPAQAGVAWARCNIKATATERATSPGQWLTKVGHVVDVLQDWGYAPEVSTSEGGRTCHIDLRRCPFLDLARTRPAVVCGIHGGLITGAMEELGEPDVEFSLEPFVGPELCRAHLRTRTPFVPRPNPLEES